MRLYGYLSIGFLDETVESGHRVIAYQCARLAAHFDGTHVEALEAMVLDPLDRPVFQSMMTMLGLGGTGNAALAVPTLAILGATEEAFVSTAAAIRHLGLHIIAPRFDTITANGPSLVEAWRAEQEMFAKALAKS